MGAEQAFYKDPESLQAAIDSYFQECSKLKPGTKIVKNRWMEVKEQTPPTVDGLALALGFKSYKSLWDYENKRRNGDKDWAADSITRAKTRIRQWWIIGAALGHLDPHISARYLAACHDLIEKNIHEFQVVDDRMSESERVTLKRLCEIAGEDRKSLPLPLNEED